MNNFLEIELKLVCRQEVHPQKVQEYLEAKGWRMLEGPESQDLQTTYYDSADQRLSRSGLVLRIRRKGDSYEATIKNEGQATGGLHVREEVNHSQSGPEPDPQTYEVYPLGKKMLQCLKEESLAAQFTTHFQRTRMLFQEESGALIELALDQGEILAGERSAKLNEIELELKEGQALSLLRMGEALSQAIPLCLENRSKYARGLTLVGLPQKQRIRKKAKGRKPAEDSLYQLLLEHLETLMIQEQGLALEPEDPKTLHSFRIAVRRIRALMTFGKNLFAPEAYFNSQKLLKSLLNETAESRQLDVMKDLWDAQCHGQSKGTLLWAHLDLQRKRSQGIWQEKICSGHITTLYLNLWILWQEGLFRGEKKEKTSLMTYYDTRIEQLQATFEESEKAGLRGGPEERHHWRIKAKSLRYILESFEDIHGSKEKKWIHRLKKIQDRLGWARDLQLIASTVQSWSGLALERGQSRLAFEMGQFLGWIEARSNKK